MSPHVRLSSFNILVVLFGLLSAWLISVANSQDENRDFFDIVGTTPTMLAASFADNGSEQILVPRMMAFVGLPMSKANREEFGHALNKLGDNKDAARLCLLNLLEEQVRYDQGLEMIRSRPDPKPWKMIRKVVLLWKSGKTDEALEAANHARAVAQAALLRPGDALKTITPEGSIRDVADLEIMVLSLGEIPQMVSRARQLLISHDREVGAPNHLHAGVL